MEIKINDTRRFKCSSDFTCGLLNINRLIRCDVMCKIVFIFSFIPCVQWVLWDARRCHYIFRRSFLTWKRILLPASLHKHTHSISSVRVGWAQADSGPYHLAAITFFRCWKENIFVLAKGIDGGAVNLFRHDFILYRISTRICERISSIFSARLNYTHVHFR